MATKYWLGTADAVAQVVTIQVTTFDGATTYQITVGDVVISAIGNTDVDTTATDLAAAWNLSTHPYCAGITASAATDTVTLTADIAGVPFVVTSSVTGGTGTIGAATTATSSAGPNDWSTAENWSDGSIPGASDSITFRESAINVAYGLDQSAVTINDLFVEKSYTGKIGLDRSVFATSSDAETVDTSKPEYRDHYLKIDYDVLEIGKHIGAGNPTGSGRIKIDNQNTGASTTTVFDSATVSTETSLAAVRLLANSATADFFIRSGLVGIAIDESTEISTIGDVYVNGGNSKVYIGIGVTLTTFVQSNGIAILQAAATVAVVTMIGGTLTTEGSFTITAITMTSGIVYCNHASAGNAITTLNLNGGTIVATRSGEPRTWATVNLGEGAAIQANSDILTITTLNEPAGEYKLAV